MVVEEEEEEGVVAVAAAAVEHGQIPISPQIRLQMKPKIQRCSSVGSYPLRCGAQSKISPRPLSTTLLQPTSCTR